ncbi:MAG: prepilin-type N-terminal cleavage/methylation domain-containing protein [Phycisphaera sp.]|nr:prepilin-type N-terminal cleavage/methylation domain-containing protein [Phycisphaera sp.]
MSHTTMSMNLPDFRNRPRHGQRAFSLLELLVVIFIIVLLVGLLLSALSKMKEQARERRTRVILTSLRAILDEYTTATASPITATSMTDFVATVRQLPAANTMLEGLQRDAYDRDQGRVYDAWGTEVAYRLVSNKGGTEFLPVHSTPFFASAGPDKKWGNAQTSPTGTAADNLYSYDIE